MYDFIVRFVLDSSVHSHRQTNRSAHHLLDTVFACVHVFCERFSWGARLHVIVACFRCENSLIFECVHCRADLLRTTKCLRRATRVLNTADNTHTSVDVALAPKTIALSGHIITDK